MNDDHDAPALPPVDPATVAQGPDAAYSSELLASLLADGDDDLAAWTIRHALAEASRAEVFDGSRAEVYDALVAAVRDASQGRLPVMLGGRLGAQPGFAADLDIDWVGSTIEGAAQFAAKILAGQPAAKA